jgi:hypothetical protein
MQFILITKTFHYFQNPSTSINCNEYFKIQPNEPVKTTYIPNRIGIPTHGAKIRPPPASIGVSTPKLPRSHRHTKEKERSKKEKE